MIVNKNGLENWREEVLVPQSLWQMMMKKKNFPLQKCAFKTGVSIINIIVLCVRVNMSMSCRCHLSYAFFFNCHLLEHHFPDDC